MGRLSGCQSGGNGPKNNPESGSSKPLEAFFEQLDRDRRRREWHSSTAPDQRRSPAVVRPETELEAAGARYNRQAASPANFVDNDNGELSWGLNNGVGDLSETPSSRRSSSRGVRPRFAWMSADPQGSGPNSLPGGSGSGRTVNPPNRNQVVNKLTQIRDYIQQTETIMSALSATDSPGCQEQHDKLEGMLADLRDSETKLKGLLEGMDRVDAKIDRLLDQHAQINGLNGEGPTEDDLLRRADDSRRKVEALERQRQELLDLQQRAHRQLAEAEAEKSRVLSRAAALNAESVPGRSMEPNLQSLADRLRNVERLCADQNGLIPAEQPDDGQGEGELSDTETDYQLVRDKVAELNAMKAQLAQLQAMMASVQGDQEASEDAGRRSQSRETSEPRLEGMRAKLNEVNRLVEMVRASERPEDDDSRSTTSSTRPRNSEELSVEGMQRMTRELEAHTAEMKKERDRLIAARNELRKYATLLPARRDTSSAEDSEPEHSTSLTANVAATPRNVENDEVSTRSGGRAAANGAASGGAFLGRIPPSRTRQRNAWNQSLPTLLNQETPPDRRRKELRSSQSSLRNSENGRAHPETIDWHSDLPASNAMYQTQSQLEESANLCEQMLQDSMGRSEGSADEMTGILYSQQQMLTRTVSQCCKLIWLQQRQINELRNAMILQQSASLQPQQSRDNTSQQQQQQQPANVPGDFPVNSPTLQTPRFLPNPAELAAQVPFLGYPEEAAYPTTNQPNVPSRFRPRLFNPRNPELFVNGGANTLGGQLPPGMFGPDDLGPSGALNNQVPPGNRANNYWDNFRSYSRQNLLSTSKSNEDSDPMRRAGSSRPSGNQERTPLSTAIVFPNNQSNNPVIEVQPLRQANPVSPRPGASSSNHGTVSRSRSAEPQALHNLMGPKNNSEGVTARREEPDESVTRVRNNVGTGVRNRSPREQQPDVGPSAERPNNKRARPGNLNNRSDINNGLFTLLRDSVFQEVTNFIRANETRPNFLIQLFRDLQQVTSDPQRQRALVSLQEVVGGNNNSLEVRNNIRVNENRSNLNRSANADERIEQIFDQLRENQNTIRQNISSTPMEVNGGSNLENPNISNIRDLASYPKNNLDQDRIRDMLSLLEGNNAAPTAKNRNVSNARENLADGTLSEYERMNPKNVYLSLYDRLVEDLLRRHSEEDFFEGDDATPANFGESLYMEREMFEGRDEEGAVFRTAQRGREFLMNRETSEETGGARRRGFHFADANAVSREESKGLVSRLWEPNPADTNYPAFVRPEPYPHHAFLDIFPCNNADLAEADQSRNGETSGAESENEYMNPPPTAEPEIEHSFLGTFHQNDTRPEGDYTNNQQVVAESETTADMERNENFAGAEGAWSKEPVKMGLKTREKTEVKAASPKVVDAKFREVLQHDGTTVGVGVEEAAEGNRPMMDIAGALEHLNFRQEEEPADSHRSENFAEVEADWEAENGLDQVPTRLEKREDAAGDPT